MSVAWRNSTILRHSKASNNKGKLECCRCAMPFRFAPLTDNPSNLSKTIKVIERNPVRAGLRSQIEISGSAEGVPAIVLCSQYG
jgi:hypothetical protein